MSTSIQVRLAPVLCVFFGISACGASMPSDGQTRPSAASFENSGKDGIRRLTVLRQAETEIEFELQVTDGAGLKTLAKGVAIGGPSDAELDVDGSEPYFLDQYDWAKDECWLEIKLEAQGGARAIVRAGGCDLLDAPGVD